MNNSKFIVIWDNGDCMNKKLDYGIIVNLYYELILFINY